MKPVQAPPVVDPSRDFLRETLDRIAERTGRPAPAEGEPAWALAAVFANMAGAVAERINRAPDKNFLAFLDLLGLEPRPRQAARVPLTFALAAGSPVDAVVPAGTQVAAGPLEGDPGPVVFETERDLVVSRSELVRVLTHDALRDARADHSARAAGGDGAGFEVFTATEPVPHALHLDFGPLPAVAGGARTVTVRIGSERRDVPWPRWLAWSHGAEGAERPLASTWDEERWEVTLPEVPAPAVHVLGGRPGAWLHARLTVPLRRRGEAPAALFTGSAPAALPLRPFAAAADPPLLLASPLFALAGARARVEVALAAGSPAPRADLALAWEYRRAGSEDAWTALAVEDGTGALARDGEVSLAVPADWAATTENGVAGHWLRVRLAAGGYGTPGTSTPASPVLARLTLGCEVSVPPIGALEARVEMAAGPVPASAAFLNGGVLDLSKDVFPLGTAPRFGDAFHLALPGLADKPGARVTLNIRQTNPGREDVLPLPARATPDLALRWEFWNRVTGRWATLGESGPGADEAAGQAHGFVDGTAAFTRTEEGTGDVAFTLPAEMGATTVEGIEGAWLRVRVARGGYGHDARWVPVLDEEGAPRLDGNGLPIQRLEAAEHRPPSLASVDVSYRFEAGPLPAAQALARNDVTWTDLAPGLEAGESFVPFVAAEDDPALYLGFHRPGPPPGLGTQGVSLYVSVQEPAADSGDPTAAAPAPPVVAWEYWNGGAWAHLPVEDETQGFTQRGVVAFVAPPDLVAWDGPGGEAYWLRARLAGGGYPAPPRVLRILTNTTWGVEGETLRGELLGSSNGERGQVLTTARAPVLPGAVLEVREPAAPTAAEVEVLEREGGPGAVRTLSEGGRVREVWVRWTRVADFNASGPRDRHYVLDASAGEVRFGDGARGMVPPQVPSGIRMAVYRTGGGTVGNRPAGNVAQLRTTIPYVDRVSSPEPAESGAEAETLDSLRERGPRTLRHRDRAVAPADYEDLAREASTQVAVARVMVPRTDAEAGRVRVLVVPHGHEPRPTPGVELLDRVRRHLAERASPTVAVEVVGPRWLRVSVQTQVSPESAGAARGLAERVAGRIADFLHPLHGGPEGEGWPIGRRPYKSELYATIERTPGVHHLRRLQVEMVDEATGRPMDPFATDRLLVCSGENRVELSAETD